MFRTLIVEDSAVFRRSLKEILRARFPSMVLVEAANGTEAMQKADAIRPNLIFMDIKLPGENGLELTKKMKTHYSQIIIIILTNYDIPEYREAAYQYGANYFISKSSSTTEEIVALVESIVSDLGFDLDGQKSTEKF